MLKHTFLGHIQWAKPVALILCIPLIMYSIDQMHTFTVYADEIGLEGLFKNISPESQTGMISYTQTEMLFFGVGSIIATALFPFRMVISYWRTYNRGTI
ncbi:MAG: hypothetical protein HY842_16280 [Bacteroidetes bacterium]|nr:hypothetical protein [Bacteroidota bacterium]